MSFILRKFSRKTSVSPYKWTSVAAGSLHSVGLLSDGTVRGWGGNGTYIVSPASDNSGIVSIVAGAGAEYTLAIKHDGSFLGWGKTSLSYYSNFASTNNIIGLAGTNFASGIVKSDGTVALAGSYSSFISPVPANATGIVALAISEYNAIALKSNGSVIGWGQQQGGDTPSTWWGLPIPASVNSGVIAIAAGRYHYLACKSDGTIVTWGRNNYGQSNSWYGDYSAYEIGGMNYAIILNSRGSLISGGGYASRYDVDNLPTNTNVDRISCGSYHGLATTISGEALSWGATFYTYSPETRNSNGQLTIPINTNLYTTYNRYKTIPRSRRTTRLNTVAAGANFRSFAIRNDGSVNQIGTGGAVLPSSVSGGIISIAAAENSAVALNGSGSIFGWGDANTPGTTISIYNNSGTSQIAIGAICGLRVRTGAVEGWGDDTYGQVTIPTAANSGVVKIAVGDKLCLALKDDGSVVKWGSKTLAGVSTPPSSFLSGVVDIACSNSSTNTFCLALKDNGSVVVWGDNSYVNSVPTAANSGVLAIAASDSYAIIVKVDGTVVVWGNSPGTVPSIAQTGVVHVAAGKNHFIVLKYDGTAVAWTTSGILL